MSQDRTNGKPPVKVLRVHSRLVGGSAINSVLLTAGLNDDTFQSTLVVGSAGPNETDMMYFANQHGIEPRLIPEMGREVSWRHDVVAFFKLYRLMRELKPQIVHTHSSKAGAIGRLAAFVAGVPIRLHTYHGLLFSGYYGRLKSQAVVWIERFLGLLSAHVIAISERQRTELCVQRRVVPPERCAIVPLGFDLKPFADSARLRGEIRRTVGCPADWQLVGIVGRVVPIKNHAMFLEVARRVLEVRPNVGFVIAGDGELEASLKQTAQERGLAGHVHFLGWRRDSAALYADMDVVALTSLNEGTPVSLIEAMAAGRAVVSTEVGGVADVVQDGVSGLLVPSGDVEACARAMLRLLEDDALRERLGREGQTRVLARYGSDRLVGDVSRLYHRLLAQRGLSGGLPEIPPTAPRQLSPESGNRS